MAAKLYVFVLVYFLIFFSFIFSNDELKTLDDVSFEHLTQAATGATTGDWLIVFSNDHSECSSCKTVEDLLIKIHAKFQHKLNIAKVLPSSKLTTKRFEVTKWPSVSLFHQGLRYYYTSDSYEEETLIEFIEQFNKFASRRVPEPITMFDVVIEDLMDDVKHIIHIRKNAAVLIFCSGVLFGLMLTQVLKCIVEFFISTFSKDGGSEEEEEEEEEEKDEKKDKRRKKNN
ncbi:hypothetical protein QZH41_018442 [Actinostola sp. cb2023]|nr:hypothetical protein QZH41_018442 [Actinostola sp. cb2023]